MEEKKKIWKLIKLYRAYLTDDIKRDMYVNWADEKLIDLVEAEEVEEEDLYKFLNQLSVLKKFIKWLVENDKIDEVKLRWKMYQVFEFRYQDVATLENELLMLLSIQDEPIEFLISILKNV
jgi:hypothetical protein